MELVNKVANALASMTGMSYVQVQGLLNELGALKEVEQAKTEVKPIKK